MEQWIQEINTAAEEAVKDDIESLKAQADAAKLKVENSVVWLIGSILLILMSIFYNVVEWISVKLGFIAPVNFVFLVVIFFLLIQTFIDNIRISLLNEKIKDLDHYIALKEYEINKK